ncbi:MAG: low affinity iron permease family protein [Janthinobacterium lividum]
MNKPRSRIILPTPEVDTVPTSFGTAYAGAHPLMRAFDRFASQVTRWAGSPVSFCIAALSVIVWLVTGPIFHYSNAWQLVINTGTTIITFLMVFLIQQSQNKDSVAVHLKLNELLSALRSADNAMIGIEDASEDELLRLAAMYEELANHARGRAGAADGTGIDANANISVDQARVARSRAQEAAQADQDNGASVDSMQRARRRSAMAPAPGERKIIVDKQAN